MDKLKLYTAVEKLIQKGQIDKALQGLEQILKSDPTDLKALNRAADLYLKEGNAERAIDALKKVGNIYSKDGFYSKAVAIYKRVLKIDHPVPKEELMEVHHQLATLYGQLGLVSDAMSHFSIVVDFYDQTGNQAALFEALKKVSDLDPTNIESQLKLVELALAQKQEAEAEESLERLVEHVESRKSPADLIRVLEKGADFFPKNAKRLQNLVDALISVNEPKKALAKIQMAFRADPRNPVILEMLSSTFLALKQPDKSRAVDVELVKLYRQSNLDDKVKVVEARIKGQVSVQPTTSKKSESAGVEDVHDPVESLIKALPLTVEEKKVISECEVYFKYGLIDKAYEVLKSRLGQFPQSLILRWKLKACTQDLKKSEESAHLLSEIILLAKNLNLEIWADLAATELKAIDPSHPALSGGDQSKVVEFAKSKAVQPATQEKEKGPVVVVLDDESPREASADELQFESGEVSIVIDEEVSDEGEFSEISLQDLNDTGPLKEEESTLDLAEEAARISEVEVKDSTPIDLPGESATVANAPIELDMESENILSEADFTSEELSQLGLELVPDVSNVRPKVNAPKAKDLEPTSKSAAKAEEKHPNEISSPIDLGLFIEDKDSSPAMDPEFEVKQGIEEMEFFKSQGLDDEASALLMSLRARFPNYKGWSDIDSSLVGPTIRSSVQTPKANNRSLEVETLGRKVKLNVQEDLRADGDEDFFDLAGELRAEVSEPVESKSPPEVKEVFSAFKKGVAATVGEEDWQTHFDLGIAYREMGLLEDAIEEFKIVSKTPGQKISALYQMGLTKMAMELYGDAKDIFDKALREPDVAGQEKLSVSYELAEALLKLNDKAKAKKLFEEVRRADPEFREVQEKIKAIG